MILVYSTLYNFSPRKVASAHNRANNLNTQSDIISIQVGETDNLDPNSPLLDCRTKSIIALGGDVSYKDS
jgi:hypothetical protein